MSERAAPTRAEILTGQQIGPYLVGERADTGWPKGPSPKWHVTCRGCGTANVERGCELRSVRVGKLVRSCRACGWNGWVRA